MTTPRQREDDEPVCECEDERCDAGHAPNPCPNEATDKMADGDDFALLCQRCGASARRLVSEGWRTSGLVEEADGDK